MTTRTWRRAERCAADNPQCVEVARFGDDVVLRDSKNPTGGTIRASVATLRRLAQFR